MKTTVFFILITLFFSCKGKKEKEYIQSQQGGIDIISNFYFNASKGLDSVKSVHLSKINYRDKLMIELVPNVDFTEFTDYTFVIKDSLYYDITGTNTKQFVFTKLLNISAESIYQKDRGVVFSKTRMPFFENRKNLPDTLLFNKKYKRFEIHNKDNYAIFYVCPTDTLLPYSIYPEESKVYNGRIERIDSYNKDSDLFVSLQLVPRKKWDDEAQAIFDFNDFVQQRNKPSK